MASGKKKILEKHKKELLGDELKKWEDGNYYGDSPRKMTNAEAEAWEKARAKVHPTSIRLPPALLKELKKKAEENGLGLHAFIRMLLTRAIKKSA